MMDLDSHPVLSTRKDGSRLVGTVGAFAEDLYKAGTPPMHGLALRHTKSQRVALVRIGDQLTVERDGKHWVCRDQHEVLGVLRWTPSLDGKADARNGHIIRLPERGTLTVERLVLSAEGGVIDFGGTVVPDDGIEVSER
jgi:hypothetical protein